MRFGHVPYMWTNYFPDGPPGVGLLLARAALGVVCVLQGRCYLINADTAGWLAGTGTLVLGGFFAAGLLTPVAAIFGIVGGLLVAFSVIPDCSATLSHSSYALLLVGTTLLEVLLAGPGAYSIDARLFGRREIIIPRMNSSYEP
jgi:hypothetical protein